MSHILDSDVSTSIPLQELQEELSCSICLQPYEHPTMIQTCGHTFCEKCIYEVIDRNHRCPLCNQQNITIQQLIKNHGIQRIIDRINTKCIQNVKQSVVPSNIDSSNIGITDVSLSTPFANAMTTLQSLHTQHTTHYTCYQQIIIDLHTQYKHELQQIQQTLQTTLVQNINKDDNGMKALDIVQKCMMDILKTSVLPNNLPNALQSVLQQYIQQHTAVKQQYIRRIDRIVKEYDSFVAGLPPSPFLIPIICHITIPSCSSHTELKFEISISRWFSFQQLHTAIGQHCQQHQRDTKDCKYIARYQEMAHGIAKDVDFTIDPTSCLFDTYLYDYPIDKELNTTISLNNNQQKCFISSYDQSIEQRMDYYKCVTCQSNWICKSCSNCCHEGHIIQSFMLNHKVTWPCCYCNKKYNCSLK